MTSVCAKPYHIIQMTLGQEDHQEPDMTPEMNQVVHISVERSSLLKIYSHQKFTLLLLNFFFLDILPIEADDFFGAIS